MLFNPSSSRHSVYNLGGPDDLVVGYPVRYKQPKSCLANNPFATHFLGAWAKLSPAAAAAAAAHLKEFQTVDEGGSVGLKNKRLLIPLQDFQKIAVRTGAH